jgi:hypothetical protein
MCLRRAVPKIPAKSSVLPGSLLNKLRPISTRSESTLPQTLIPRDFISFSRNVYGKPGRVHPFRAQKFVNSLLAPARSCAHARTPAITIPSMLYFISSGHPGVGYLRVGQPNSSPSCGFRAMNLGCPFSQRPENHRSRITGHGTRVTEHESRNTGHGPRPHGPPVPLRRNPQSARITPVAQGGTAGRKHIRSIRCLMY